MFENRNRVKSYLETIIQETELIPDVPALNSTAKQMLEDLKAGMLDIYIE